MGCNSVLAPQVAAPQAQQQWQPHCQTIHILYPRAVHCHVQVQAAPDLPALPPIEPIAVLAPPATRSPPDYQLYHTYTSTPRNSPATVLLQCDYDELREKTVELRRESSPSTPRSSIGLCTFEAAQKDYFDRLEETAYTEKAGIMGPLTLLLKPEEVIATMTTGCTIGEGTCWRTQLCSRGVYDGAGQS
ncbi:uncharacterized protein YALI1_F37171g [Yarrowia lipolytica]|uniref:Uncharacterized protein n=1 Tax=Yarrowia lipolytica TaxID=4952 RepID=A0A1D8NQF9_YARLL|nr:hypothetical protein YALI1_F37171g [Yarrowia lipolytica]